MSDVQLRRQVGQMLYVLQELSTLRRWSVARYRRDWKRSLRTCFTTRWFLADAESFGSEHAARIWFSHVAPRRGNM